MNEVDDRFKLMSDNANRVHHLTLKLPHMFPNGSAFKLNLLANILQEGHP